MRTRQTMTISLPPEMIQKVELVRKAEHRTRSELVREALRTYFVRARPYEPTAAERREIEKGRTAVKRGDYYSIDEFRGAVGGPDKKGRLKGAFGALQSMNGNASSQPSRGWRPVRSEGT